MGQKPRPRPKRLPVKLRQIREQLGVSQLALAGLLRLDVSAAGISEYESGDREPNLLTLLAYARIAKATVEQLIDDKLNLP